jgi:succinoglycan biosynthesis protein ExoW
MIGVIVPYFQRSPGLLRRAVRSALDQSGIPPSLIVIVDDGSPHPARLELEAFSEAERRNIALIEQSNAGVSTARNRALDAMPDTIDTIAFLDPDDTWHADHLLNAQVVLDHGCDFYFADHIREGADCSRFVECGLNPADHIVIDAVRSLFNYAGSLFDAIVRQSPVGTSTVVYRRDIGPEVRFEMALSANEDALFWLKLLAQRPRIAFRGKVSVDYGTGVGLFASAKWGTARNLRYLADIAAYHRSLPRLFRLSPELDHWNKNWRRQIRRDFALNVMHIVRHRETFDWRCVGEYFAHEPMMFFDMIDGFVFSKRSR